MTTTLKDVSVMREIEYKYFVDIEKLQDYLAKNEHNAIRIEDIEQYYIAKDKGNAVRLRISRVGNAIERVLCVKGSGTGINEAEHVVNEVFCDAILSDAFQTPKVEKRRITFGFRANGRALKLEVDIYKGCLEGFVVAEVEVPVDGFEVPLWTLPDFIVNKMTDGESNALSNYALAMMGKTTFDFLLSEIMSKKAIA